LGTITTREGMENYVVEQIMTTKEGEKLCSWNNLQLKGRNKILVFGNNYNQRGNGELCRGTIHDYKRTKS
jgi:hypothetical protein